MRAWSDVPIVVLSAREREGEKVAALDLGADDFVNKPFGVGELMARLRAALRHRMQRSGEVPVVRIGELEVDVAHRRVTRDGQELKLTRREFDLLSVLARHAGKVVTHKQLLHAAWGPAHEQDTQYLRTYVGQLRQKIEPDPSDPSVVLTEPGIGYRLAEPSDSSVPGPVTLLGVCLEYDCTVSYYSSKHAAMVRGQPTGLRIDWVGIGSVLRQQPFMQGY